MEAFTESKKAARRVGLTLGVGMLLLLAVVAFTLTRSPVRVVRVGTKTLVLGGTTASAVEVCQAGETLPAGATAIRLAAGSYFGPPVHLSAFSGSQLIAHGSVGATWTGTSVTVPITPLKQTVANVRLCINISPNSELIAFKGVRAVGSQAAVYGNGESLNGRVGVEYLAPGRSSWWSQISTVATHIGRGHALTGGWVVLLILALVAGAAVAAIAIVVRELA